MSGFAVIGELLRADPALQVFLAARGGLTVDRQVKAGRLADAVALPALLVRTISVIDQQMLKRVGWVRVTARVSVTVRAANYEDQVEAIRLVRLCCAGKTGDIGGGTRVSILTAGTGPDLAGPADSFEQAQDFRVSADELA